MFSKGLYIFWTGHSLADCQTTDHLKPGTDAANNVWVFVLCLSLWEASCLFSCIMPAGDQVVMAMALYALCREPASRVAKRCYGVGAQMQHFFRQYLLYVTFEVLEPLWAAMAASLSAATTLDQVSQGPPARSSTHYCQCYVNIQMADAHTALRLGAPAFLLPLASSMLQVSPWPHTYVH